MQVVMEALARVSGSQLGCDFTPRRHLAISGDIYCHNWEGVVLVSSGWKLLHIL